jgi:hypothetical protein
VMRPAQSILHNGYYLDEQIKEDEMGGACATYGAMQKCI